MQKWLLTSLGIAFAASAAAPLSGTAYFPSTENASSTLPGRPRKMP
jgi:hypothetical protein